MESKISFCTSCGARIRWIRMKIGKYMPCNADRVAMTEEPGGEDKIVTEKGAVISGRITKNPCWNCRMGYISHFATCPYAGKHRKKEMLK